MNVFFRELKSHRLGLIFWSLGMVALVGSGMAKFAAYSTSGQSISDIIAQFPKAFQIVFGLSGFDLSKASGFFGLLFIYIVLMGTVHAVLLGSDLITKEERDRTAEFLFVRPISRNKVITAKLLAGLFNLIIFNLVTTVSSLYFVNYFNKGGPVNHDILVLMAALFFLQLIFFAIGASVASRSKKPKGAASFATAVLLATFILSFLINLNDKLDILKYFTPFKYFEAKILIESGNLGLGYVTLSLAIIGVLTAATYYFYAGRDLTT